MPNLKNQIRFWLMPGYNVFTRRRVRLSRHWVSRPRKVLDAGSGNGWFSYLAYRSGATVTAVNIEAGQVDKAVKFYNDWLGIPTERLQFRQMNLYNVETLPPGFDEIICYETLEHIKQDAKVCAAFWKLLNPGGSLHLCCPYAEHPRWKNEWLDLEENGYHVRAGYTLESYRALLEPIGFRITATEGMGGTAVRFFSSLMHKVQAHLGDAWCLPVMMASIPFLRMDPTELTCPYSLYVRAQKPASNG